MAPIGAPACGALIRFRSLPVLALASLAHLAGATEINL